VDDTSIAEPEKGGTMSIDGIQGKSNLIVLPAGVNPKAQPQARPDKNASARSDDAVSISDNGCQFQRVRRMVDSQPDFRLAKVNSLTKAIEEGTYNKKGEMIADALIRRNLIDLMV
jgi:flagellar biosynthesis anti-sigma factor FlgM